MKRVLFLIHLFLFFSTNSYSQITIGSTEKSIKAGLLDLKTDIAKTSDIGTESSDKGLLLPRVMLTNINELSPFINSATNKEKLEHIGLTVYNVNTVSPFLAGIYIWNGSSWGYAKQQKTTSIFNATNGTSKASKELRLGGTLIEETVIDQNKYNLNFKETTGTFSINNTLIVSNTNTGIGVTPIPTAKLNIGGETNIGKNLNINSSTKESTLKKTDLTGLLFYKDPNVSNPKGHILRSTDSNGKAEWSPITSIPNYESSKYTEATFTGSGITIPIATWNTTTATYSRPVNTVKLTLTPGLWLIYISIVIEPEVVSTANADPIWGRFSLRLNQSATPSTNVGDYTDIGTSTNTTNGVYFIGGINVSDRLYPNISKNVVKGYLVARVLDSTKNLYLWVGTRAANNGYVTWPTSVTNVKVADPNDPQNYIVAFPL